MVEGSICYLAHSNNHIMKAIIRCPYGAPSVIEITGLPKPRLQPNGVLVRVSSFPVNRADCANLTILTPIILKN